MTLMLFPSLSAVLAWPVNRTPIWDTVKNEALSGRRVRYSNRSYPTYQWEVSFNVLRSAAAYLEWQQLQDFLNNLRGGVGMFLYDDPNDDTATAAGFGFGDGATTTFQLVRTLPGGTFGEPVFFPNVVSNISAGGVTISPSNYTVNSYGTITFATPPNGGAALIWTGSFRWGCRIDDDGVPFSNFMSNLFELKSLKFSSEKLP